MRSRPGSRATSGTWLSVVPSIEPLSDAGEQLTHEVRDLASPIGTVLVNGPSAQLVDSKSSLLGRMPWAALWIAVSTFVLLFLMFGSVVVPIKALVLNVLSLTATFGAMVWIFQDGHLSGLLDFTAIGSLAATMPILMFCVAFGLSMDYEVFLLSRIKEEHDISHDNRSSVAIGLERTGRIVTAAAADHQRGVHRVLDVGRRVREAVRHRARARGAHGRVRDPLHAGARVHGARGRGELVGAEAASSPVREDRHPGIGAARAAPPRRPRSTRLPTSPSRAGAR